MAERNHDEMMARAALAAAYERGYYARRQRIASSLTSEQMGFLEGNQYGLSIQHTLEAALRDPRIRPSAYLEDWMGWLFDKVFSARVRDEILYFADRMSEYPFGVRSTRRSLRARDHGAYADWLCSLIRSYFTSLGEDVSLDRILDRRMPEDFLAYVDTYPWREGYCAWQVAYALDHDEPAVEASVRRILTEENGAGRVTHALIRGVMLSHRTELHALMGKLLLAARLQEGLRQAICECADGGTAEAFLTILHVITENNLIRFSSVKRAVGTWLGLMTAESGATERISAKSIRLIEECLTDECARERYLLSEDAMELYIALWSYGFFDIHEAVKHICEMAVSGTPHQLLVASYFAENLDLSYVTSRIAGQVLRRYHERTDLLAVWLPLLLHGTYYALWRSDKHPVSLSTWFDSPEELDGYYDMLKGCLAAFEGKQKTFSPCIFPWHEVTLKRSDLAEAVGTLAALSQDTTKIDEACELIGSFSADHRDVYIKVLLREPRTETCRRTALAMLTDKSTSARREAWEIVRTMTLSGDEYRTVESYLRFKSSDIRHDTMQLLLRQEDGALAACLTRLLASTKEDVRLGAMDMLTQLRKDDTRRALADRFTEMLADRADDGTLSEKEKLMLSQLVPSVRKKEIPKLFSSGDRYLPPMPDPARFEPCFASFAKCFPDSALPTTLDGRKQKRSFAELLRSMWKPTDVCASASEAAEDLRSLSAWIEEHKTASFTNSLGETFLLGDISLRYVREIPSLNSLWDTWAKQVQLTNGRLIRALILFRAYSRSDIYTKDCDDVIRTVFGAGFERRPALPHENIVDLALRTLSTVLPPALRRELAIALTVWFMCAVPDDKVLLNAPVWEDRPGKIRPAHLLAHRQLLTLYAWLTCRNDETLDTVFPLAVASAERCLAASKGGVRSEPDGYPMQQAWRRALLMPYAYETTPFAVVGVRAYLSAAFRGIITKPQLYAFLMHADNIQSAMETVTDVTVRVYERDRKHVTRESGYRERRLESSVRDFLGKETDPDEEDTKLLRFVTEIYEEMIPVMLDTELARGNGITPYTIGMTSIARIYGARRFADILGALGSDTIVRSAYYGWESTTGRREVLSYLLSVCVPSDGDTAETLAEALAGRGIKKGRLIEAALYAPAWISLVGEYLGIPSFESVCYYFIAHMNERFDDRRRAIIARYTPLTEEELNEGAFDVAWFRTAYASIGEKEFNLIYDAAKYISDGTKHTRARKYADAAIGRFRVEEQERIISDKRNKDLLMAYALIPLAGEEDLIRRYLFIQRFKKESRQFGAQRIASEGKAVEMALRNLATNAGYADTMRLTLRMETKVMEESRVWLAPQTAEDVTLSLSLDENGRAELTASKNGKVLKSIPQRIKKHETVLSLTEWKKTLTEQYRRSRIMLETAMEDGTRFTYGELLSLTEHAVLAPMLGNLVFIGDDVTGFLTRDGLCDAMGTCRTLAEDAELRLAHPYDLYARGCWRDYQRVLYERQIRQPFRQVFRELYVKTEDERDTYRSLRYAGNQIQPAKTVAVLKGRRWVADIEDGLQKIYYKENIVASIYALADWFSPADIEAPTLEWVCFTDRRTWRELKLSEIPDVIFSEVMRDVDLAVSVAHAGGVDPETSHSTVEMRAAILSFVLPMFGIQNVRVEGHHAIVDGERATYSVHLGSGVVHRLGGAMIPVLPVHSQHRGRIFLPFVDDDPKTAQVISTVLLFAEDRKIKDPSILSLIAET